MSKFSIDLIGLSLPDAIAAVVEAWYEAQSAQSSETELEKMIGISNEIIKDKQLKSKLKLSMYIERRGGKLAIRGRLPVKTNDGSASWATQRISIGISSNSSNVKKAEILTCLLIDQLKDGDFKWDNWSDSDYIVKLYDKIDTALNPAPVTVGVF